MHLKTFHKDSDFTKETVNFISSLNLHTIALSGGHTPGPVYKNLGKALIHKNIDFYQVDERYVPKTHPHSNYKLIKQTLFDNTTPKKFHYFDTSLAIIQSLKTYRKQLPKSGFDLCILGIGEDGHTASLFPNSPALKSASPVAHTTSKFKIHDRLTLTFPYILKSKTILILLKNKPGIIKELQNSTKNIEEFPALKILEHSNLIIHYLQN